MMESDCAEIIINLEKSALERWGKGDPSGFLEISAPEVVYFDPFTEFRIDGLEALKTCYEAIRGQIKADSFRLLNPKVQLADNVGVLTFNYLSTTDGKEDRWNCTEVYKNIDGEWKIIQTHWSVTQPFK
ncbi:MAG: YybH family protein [Ignavibacteriales bacterium]